MVALCIYLGWRIHNAPETHNLSEIHFWHRGIMRQDKYGKVSIRRIIRLRRIIHLFYATERRLIRRGSYTAARRYEFYIRAVKTIFYERAQRVSKILFLPREIKFISSSHCVIFFLLYGQEHSCTNSSVKAGNDSLVRIWKRRHSSPGCSFVWILLDEWSIFPLKHTCLYNKSK